MLAIVLGAGDGDLDLLVGNMCSVSAVRGEGSAANRFAEGNVGNCKPNEIHINDGNGGFDLLESSTKSTGAQGAGTLTYLPIMLPGHELVR